MERIASSFLATAILALAAGCAGTNNSAPKASSSQRYEAAQKLCAEKDYRDVNQRALLAGGYYALQNKDLDCAERLTAEARKLDAKDPFAALNLGAIYERQNRLTQAKREYNEAITLDPKGEYDSVAVEVTTDKAMRLSPGQIAKRNLARLERAQSAQAVKTL